MMNLSCEYCGKNGTLEEHTYAGKRLRLKCPYCFGSFIFKVPGNGSAPQPSPEPSETVARLAQPMLDEATKTAPPAQPAGADMEPPPVAEAAPVVEVDEALVHEAKRIARLIISEIKLYNQDKIARAKGKREVLELLKHDLIKGKQHYNTRIASKLPSSPDYFMDTVKEILLAGKS